MSTTSAPHRSVSPQVSRSSRKSPAGKIQSRPVQDQTTLSASARRTHPSSQEVLSKQRFDNLIHLVADMPNKGDVHRRYLPSLRAAAQAGNPEALAILRKMGRFDNQALQYLGEAGQHLKSEDIALLEDQLDSRVAERRKGAYRGLLSAARRGNQQAHSRARKFASKASAPTAYVDALAHLGPALTPDDYQLLLERGSSRAEKWVGERAKLGDLAALDGIGQAVVDPSGPSLSKRVNRNLALNAWHSAADQLKPHHIEGLEDLVRDGQAEKGHRDKAIGVLARAALNDPPVQGSVDAFAGAIQHYTRDWDGVGSSPLPIQVQSSLEQSFRKLSPSSQEKLAPHLLRSADDPDLARAGMAALKQKAIKGDSTAIRSLKRTLRNPAVFTEERNAVRRRAAQILGEAAKNGQGEALDALIEEFKRPTISENSRVHVYSQETPGGMARDALASAAKSFRPEDLESLGQAATDPEVSTLGEESVRLLGMAAPHQQPEELDRIKAHLREAHQLGYSRERESAVAMNGIAEKLSTEDHQLLAKELSEEGVKTLLKAAPSMSEEQRHKLLDVLSSQLNHRLKATTAAELMAQLTPHLRDQDTLALREAVREQGYLGDDMRPILYKPEASQQNLHAAQALADSGMNKKDPDWDRFVSVIASSHDEELKTNALNRLKNSPISKREMQSVAMRVEENFGRVLAEAPEGSNLEYLRNLYYARHLGENPSEDFHKKIDLDHVNKEIERTLERPDVVAVMHGIRRQSVAQTFQDKDPAQLQADYLTGKDFQQRLQLLPPKESEALLKSELGKLQALNPELVEGTATKVMQNQFQSTLEDQLQALPESERHNHQAQAIDKLMEADPKFRAEVERLLTQAEEDPELAALLSEEDPDSGKAGAGLGVSKKATAAAHKMTKLLKVAKVAGRPGADGLAIGEKPDAVVKALSKAMPDSVVKSLSKLNETGVLSSINGGAAMLSLGLHFPPKNLQDGLTVLGDATSIYGDVKHMATLANRVGLLSSRATGAIHASKFLKFAKLAGPIGAGIGAIGDTIQVGQELMNDDYGGAAGKLTSGIGAAVIFAAPGWGLLLFAGGMAIDHFFGESPEETMLRQLGVFR